MEMPSNRVLSTPTCTPDFAKLMQHFIINSYLFALEFLLTNNEKNSPDLEIDLFPSIHFLLESVKLNRKEERKEEKRQLIWVNGKHRKKCIKVHCQAGEKGFWRTET